MAEVSQDILIERLTPVIIESVVSALTAVTEAARKAQGGAVGAARRWLSEDLKETLKAGAENGKIPKEAIIALAAQMNIIKPETAETINMILPYLNQPASPSLEQAQPTEPGGAVPPAPTE
jgi:hypothetical protein